MIRLQVNRDHGLAFCLSMIFFRNRFPLFGILPRPATAHRQYLIGAAGQLTHTASAERRCCLRRRVWTKRGLYGQDDHMATSLRTLVETRRDQMFPVLEAFEIERLRRFGGAPHLSRGRTIARRGPITACTSFVRTADVMQHALSDPGEVMSRASAAEGTAARPPASRHWLFCPTLARLLIRRRS